MTVKVTASATAAGKSKDMSIKVKKADSEGKLGLWDDDGIFRFKCCDGYEYELSANDVVKNGLYDSFHGCGELKDMTLFNYYIYDYEEGTIYAKYKDDCGIKVTLYACTDNSVYKGGIVMSECTQKTVSNQNMGEQDDCTDILLSGCDFSFGELYVGIKVTFSDGAEYWAKLDDTSYDGGKPLIQSDCYMVGLYNSSAVYTTATTRKTITYYTDEYDVYFTLDTSNGYLKFDSGGTGCPEEMSFTDNFGHTYIIPANTTGVITLDQYSQYDKIYREALNHIDEEGSYIIMMSPLSSAWWYAVNPKYETAYILTEDTEDYATYTKYIFRVDK